MNFTMEDRDAEEFVLVLQGYYRLLAGRELFVDLDKDMWNQESGTSNHSRLPKYKYLYIFYAPFAIFYW